MKCNVQAPVPAHPRFRQKSSSSEPPFQVHPARTSLGKCPKIKAGKPKLAEANVAKALYPKATIAETKSIKAKCANSEWAKLNFAEAISDNATCVKALLARATFAKAAVAKKSNALKPS